MYKRQYYFDYKGNRYKCGTIVTLNNSVKTDIFEFYLPEKKLYKLYKHGWCDEKHFYGCVTGVTNEVDEKYLMRKKQEILKTKMTFSKEINYIDGLGLAWLWYAFLMAITFIFNGRIFYWMVITFVFFIYRGSKLRQYGYEKRNCSWYKIN